MAPTHEQVSAARQRRAERLACHGTATPCDRMPKSADHAVHELQLVRQAARYPFRAVCSCGWQSWGYLTERAARVLLEDHAAKTAH